MGRTVKHQELDRRCQFPFTRVLFGVSQRNMALSFNREPPQLRLVDMNPHRIWMSTNWSPNKFVTLHKNLGCGSKFEATRNWTAVCFVQVSICQVVVCFFAVEILF